MYEVGEEVIIKPIDPPIFTDDVYWNENIAGRIAIVSEIKGNHISIVYYTKEGEAETKVVRPDRVIKARKGEYI